MARFHRENHGAGLFTDVDGGGDAGGERGDVRGDAGEGEERHVASSASVAATQFDKERMATMKAFWLPSKTPTVRLHESVDPRRADCRMGRCLT